MLPKVKTPDEVVWLDELLTERGHATRLHVIIETNAALEAVYDIAKSSPRIDALFFGGVDMAAELRCKNAYEPLLYARSRIAHAAAGAGLDVYDQEPLPADHKLRMLPNTVLMPHVGGRTRENFVARYRDSLEDVQAWLAGKPVRVLS